MEGEVKSCNVQVVEPNAAGEGRGVYLSTAHTERCPSTGTTLLRRQAALYRNMVCDMRRETLVRKICSAVEHGTTEYQKVLGLCTAAVLLLHTG
jgi:hypothetical protein